MQVRHVVIASALLILTGCQHGTAVPQVSRTAIVHNVKLGMTQITPADITVNVGDEVIFSNERTQPIRLVLIEGGRTVACQRGFTGYVDQEAQLAPGETASFCFEKPGTVKFMARSKGVIEGAESVLPGQVIVQRGAPAAAVAAAALTNVPETSRTATVHDVRVSLTDVLPAELSVDAGDEVRFINDRVDVVHIILVEAGKNVACKRGFKGAVDQEAELGLGESASFCFERPATVKYMVRSKLMGVVGGTDKVLSSEIQIREGSAQSIKTRDKSKPSQSDAEVTRMPKE